MSESQGAVKQNPTGKGQSERSPKTEGPVEEQNEEQAISTTEPRQNTVVTYSARFAGFVALLGALVAFGILTFNPVVIAGAGILLIFMLASILQTPTTPDDSLTVTHTVEPRHPRPGDTVEITVKINNTGDTTFPDLRVVDTVPTELKIVTGSPRAAGVLRPGNELEFSYTVIAKRGTYQFGPVVARSRTVTGTMWAEQPLETDESPAMRCTVRADEIPLEERATHFIGRLLSEVGGDGIEFYSTREYHRGDSPSRINWRLLAKRGELSTITYRESQAAEVSVILDARDCVYTSATPGTPIAPVLSTYAAYQITATLTQQGHFTALTVPGLKPRESRLDGNTTFPYRRFEPRRSTDQQYRVFEILDEIDDRHNTLKDDGIPPAPSMSFSNGNNDSVVNTANMSFDPANPDVTIESFVQDLLSWGTATTQFIFITPLTDDGAYALAAHLLALGHPLVIISPDVTNTQDTATEQNNGGLTSLAVRHNSVQRAAHVEALRHQGATVIDWNPSKPLSVCSTEQTLPGA